MHYISCIVSHMRQDAVYLHAYGCRKLSNITVEIEEHCSVPEMWLFVCLCFIGWQLQVALTADSCKQNKTRAVP